MKYLTVCVTGAGGGGFGEQILKALRRSAQPYRLLATDMSRNSAGFCLADETDVLPPASDAGYSKALLELCEKFEVRAVLPGSEPEITALSENRQLFKEKGIFLPLGAPETLSVCADKATLFSRLQSMGFTVPWFREISSASQLTNIPLFPIIFKPSALSGGSVDVFIVQDQEEADAIGLYLLKNRGRFLAQEYVGTPEQEYTVGLLFAMDGKLLSAVGLKRNLASALSRRSRVKNRTPNAALGEWLTVSSGISQGTLAPYMDVCMPCVDMARALQLTGPVNIQCRFVDGKVHLLEINLRFSGTTSIRAMGGVNEPDILLRRHLLGEVLPDMVTASDRLTVMRRLEEITVISL